MDKRCQLHVSLDIGERSAAKLSNDRVVPIYGFYLADSWMVAIGNAHTPIQLHYLQVDKIHIIKEGYAWDDPVIAPIQPEEIDNLAHILSPAEPVLEPQDEKNIVAVLLILYDTDGGSIYLQSFAMIRAEQSPFLKKNRLHAAGLVELAPFIHFSPDFVSAARKALIAGAPIFCDARMVSEGITPARLPAK